jgi:chromosome segregation ATPase
MEGLLASLIPTLLVGALTWHTTRVRRDRDQLDQQRAEQLKDLRARQDRHEDELQEHALEIQAAKAAVGVTSADVEELKIELREIRDNMVRKDDLSREMEGLRSWISSALRLTPVNKRR